MSRLSVAQERNLWSLYRHGRWLRAGQYQTCPNTLDSLVDLGYAERRLVFPSYDYEYRLTAAGLARLRSLAD